MSSATKPAPTGLSSVWDTLNAIKARQRAAETAPAANAATRRTGAEPGAARKRLLELFEKRVAEAADARNAAAEGAPPATATATASASASASASAASSSARQQQQQQPQPQPQPQQKQGVTIPPQFQQSMTTAADANAPSTSTSTSASTSTAKSKTTATATATAAESSAAHVIATFEKDCCDDEQVAKLREMYIERARKDPRTQLAAARRLLKEGEDSAVVARHALRGAQRVAKGLVGVAGG